MSVPSDWLTFYADETVEGWCLRERAQDDRRMPHHRMPLRASDQRHLGIMGEGYADKLLTWLGIEHVWLRGAALAWDVTVRGHWHTDVKGRKIGWDDPPPDGDSWINADQATDPEIHDFLCTGFQRSTRLCYIFGAIARVDVHKENATLVKKGEAIVWRGVPTSYIADVDLWQVPWARLEAPLAWVRRMAVV